MAGNGWLVLVWLEMGWLVVVEKLGVGQVGPSESDIRILVHRATEKNVSCIQFIPPSLTFNIAVQSARTFESRGRLLCPGSLCGVLHLLVRELLHIGFMWSVL